MTTDDTAPVARKPTPGPWNAAAGPSSVVGWPVVSTEGRSICSLTWFSHTMLPSLSDAEYADFMAEVRANARLIAAAPDLLEALKRLSTQMRNLLLVAEAPNRFATSFNEGQAQADAAIAKAESQP